MHDQQKPIADQILQRSINEISSGLQIVLTVANRTIAQQLTTDTGFHEWLHDLCTTLGKPLARWILVDPTGIKLAHSPEHPMVGNVRSIIQEFDGDLGALQSIQDGMLRLIGFQVARGNPESQSQFFAMMDYCLQAESDQIGSVLTFHPSGPRRATDHHFFFANAYLDVEKEELTHKDLASNPNFTQPIILNGRSVDPHWGYQPQRLADLCQSLDQNGKVDGFTYMWKNPSGRIVRGVLDYQIFPVGDLVFRASRHIDLQFI